MGSRGGLKQFLCRFIMDEPVKASISSEPVLKIPFTRKSCPFISPLLEIVKTTLSFNSTFSISAVFFPMIISLVFSDSHSPEINLLGMSETVASAVGSTPVMVRKLGFELEDNSPPRYSRVVMVDSGNNVARFASDIVSIVQNIGGFFVFLKSNLLHNDVSCKLTDARSLPMCHIVPPWVSLKRSERPNRPQSRVC